MRSCWRWPTCPAWIGRLEQADRRPGAACDDRAMMLRGRVGGPGLSMNRLPQKTTWILVAFVGSIFAFQVLSIPWAQWREHSVYQALRSGVGPEFWWPPGWRTRIAHKSSAGRRSKAEGRSRGHLRPQDRQHDGAFGRPVAAGIIELVSEDQNAVFRAIVAKGKYSFLPRAIARWPIQGTSYFSGWSPDRMAASGAARFRSSPDQLVILKTTRMRRNGPWSRPRCLT